MASTWSSLKFELIGTGEQAGTWGITTNANLGDAIEQAIGGKADITMSSTSQTLTLTDTTALQDARALYLNLSGTPGGAATLNVPAVEKAYIVYNGTTGGYAVTVKVSGQTGVSVPNGKTMVLYDDGTDVVDTITHLSSLTLSTALPVASGGTGVTTSTGTGSVVLSNSPTLVTPALGTPASATLTNATGLPISTGVSGLGANVATFLATPSSTNLRTAVTDETGSGALVFATSPTLVTPALGTPASGTLTNCTGLPVSTGVSGLGTGVATFLTTPSSTNLRSAVTDETGSGSLVFATSPTLVTPALGTPSSGTLTSCTGLPLSTGVTGTLPLANGGTGAALTDPNADRILFWDDSAGSTAFLTAGSGLSISGTTLTATGTGGTVTSVNGTGTVNGITLTGTVTSSGSLTLGGALSGVDLTSQVTGTLPVANGGTGVTTSTGTGSAVLSNSPTLVAPALGTPASATLTNATGLPISTGVSGLGTGVATFLATPSSANLRSAVTDETGSGALVFATSPALTTPNLGTPSAATLTNATGLPLTTGVTGTLPVANGGTGVTTSTGTGATVRSTSPTLTTPDLGTPSAATLTNATGLPISTGVSGLGTGVATFLATPSSANLAAAVTGETGSGALVFATSPTLVTPALGTPSSATLTNATGLPLSTGVTGQLALGNGGTGAALTDPNADRILFWDDSAGTMAFLEAGSGLAISGTTISATASGGSVTSVDVSGGTTGLTTSGGPVTTSGTITLGGTLAVANGGTGVTTSTGTGSTVRSTSPTLVTPVLGTPASGTLTNCTGLPVSTGVSGLGTSVATALAVNVGSAGAFVTNGGALGTPSSGTLTNATGLPISTGVSGLGTNVATFLATPSSTNLRAAVTDETGSGSLVFATSPTLVTPNLGTPSAATLTNATGLPLTTGVTGTLPVANGGTGVTTSTGTGATVRSTSPTLVTPALGTPSSVTLTNATGLPLTTGVTGTLPVASGGTGITSFGTGVATALGQNVTGSGGMVLSTSPTLTTPNLGTPSAVNLTNATALPISTGVSGLGSGVATFLATPSSTNLRSAVTDETGSGSLVFATSPTLVTPNLGTPASGNLVNCTADGANKVGYRNVPPVGTKTTAYTLSTADVGKYVQVGTGGSISIPDSTFSEGDVVSIFNNTTGNITITCSIATAYISGAAASSASVTLSTHGVATVLFISGTICVISGSVS